MSTLDAELNESKCRQLAGALRAARALRAGRGILGDQKVVVDAAKKSRKFDDTIHGMEVELVRRAVYFFAPDYDKDDALQAYPRLYEDLNIVAPKSTSDVDDDDDRTAARPHPDKG